MQGVVNNPNSESYLDFDYNGYTAEDSSSDPNGVVAARPDMLIFAGGATCMVGADKVGPACSGVVLDKPEPRGFSCLICI